MDRLTTPPQKRTIRLVVADHEEFGYTGLLPEDSPPSFCPLSGMGVVHDIIEHMHGGPDMGSLHDEMKAFGVIHWVRGQGDYWARTTPGTIHTTAQANTHAEIVGFFRDHWWDEETHPWEPCPHDRTRGMDLAIPMIEETVLLCQQHAHEEFASEDPDDETPFLDWFDEQLPDIRAWLTVGWYEAADRFAGYQPYDVVTAWVELEQAITRCLDMGYAHPWGEACEGDVLVVTWDDSTLTASVEWDVEDPYEDEDEEDEEDEDEEDEDEDEDEEDEEW